ASSQNFPANGGTGTVNVVATPGCGWTAVSNANFVTISSGSSGTGNGVVGFTVAANGGAARNGTLTIAGQTYTVNQSAGTPGSLTLNTAPTLPTGNSGSSYSVILSASGGTPPYTWSLTSGTLPAGLTLNTAQGIIAGTPTGTGVSSFTITVHDNAGASQS